MNRDDVGSAIHYLADLHGNSVGPAGSREYAEKYQRVMLGAARQVESRALVREMRTITHDRVDDAGLGLDDEWSDLLADIPRGESDETSPAPAPKSHPHEPYG